MVGPGYGLGRGLGPQAVSPRPVPGATELDFAERTNDHSRTVDAASVVLVPPNRHRTACWIVNKSGVWIHCGLGRPATMTSGIPLAANGGSFEINFTNLYRGEITCIGASGAGNVICAVELESRYAH